MDIESLFLYLVFAIKDLEDFFRPELKRKGKRLRSKDCRHSLLADAAGFFFPERIVQNTRNMTSESLVFSRKISDVQRCLVDAATWTAAIKLPRAKLTSRKKVLLKVSYNRKMMNPWRNTASSWMHKLVLRLKTKVSGQLIALLLHMNKLGNDWPTFISKALWRVMRSLSTFQLEISLTIQLSCFFSFFFPLQTTILTVNLNSFTLSLE